jgi:hypothetical protein
LELHEINNITVSSESLFGIGRRLPKPKVV